MTHRMGGGGVGGGGLYTVYTQGNQMRHVRLINREAPDTGECD